MIKRWQPIPEGEWFWSELDKTVLDVKDEGKTITIDDGTHRLTKTFPNVFVRLCRLEDHLPDDLLWTDKRIIDEITTHPKVFAAAVAMRNDYEARIVLIQSGAFPVSVARLHELEANSVYLSEVAEPAIEGLQGKVKELEAQLLLLRSKNPLPPAPEQRLADPE